MGSAKFYASDSASQSARSFELNEGVAYVYAKKYSDAKRTTTSDALEIMKIGLHVFTIEKVYSTSQPPKGDARTLTEGTKGLADYLLGFDEENPAASNLSAGKSVFKFMRTAGKGDGVAGTLIGYYSCDSLGQIALFPGLISKTIVGTLDLPKVTQKQLTAAHESASKKVGTEVNKAFTAFKNLFKNFQDAKKKSTQYSISADYNTGKAALDAIKDAKNNIVALSDQIATEEGEKLTETVQESKSALDQLIEAVLKQKLIK